MSLVGRIGRAVLPVLVLLALVAALVRAFEAHGLNWFALRVGSEQVAITAACVVALIAARWGRPEPVLVTLVPLGLGTLGLWLWLRDELNGLETAFALAGALAACLHATLLSGWCLACWRRQVRSRAIWPWAALLLVAAAGYVLHERWSELVPDLHWGVPRVSLLAFGCLALPAQLLIPLTWRMVLRHRGLNGTPAFHHLYGAWWLLYTIAGWTAWYLLTKPSGTRLQAVEQISRIFHRVATKLPYSHVTHRTDQGPRFDPPRIVVANHASMGDIPAVLSMGAPMTVLVRGWVWNAPVMGPMTRTAGYVNVESLSHEEINERAREALGDGLSVVVFPEGTRSRTGKLGRFKKGAFAIARALDVPVTLVAVAGSATMVRPGTWWLGDATVHTSVLGDDLLPAEFSGETATEDMAAEAQRRIDAELRRLTPGLQRTPLWTRQVGGLYRYLGAIVSHYAASKAKRDPLVREILDLCPGDGPVLHAGCGYGLLSARLALEKPWRPIRGVDSDARKVEVASAALGETTGARFDAGDLRDGELTVDGAAPEVILLVDVLHYWAPEVQERMVQRLAAALAPGGRIVFRDGIADADGHGAVRFGERLALLLRFTRAGTGLFFRSAEDYRALFEAAGLSVSSTRDDLGLSSNAVWVLEGHA